MVRGKGLFEQGSAVLGADMKIPFINIHILRDRTLRGILRQSKVESNKLIMAMLKTNHQQKKLIRAYQNELGTKRGRK